MVQGMRFFYNYSLLTITEMVIVKLLYIYKFHRIAAMNEYFLTKIMTYFNCVISLVIIVISLKSSHYALQPYYIYYFESHSKPIENAGHLR